MNPRPLCPLLAALVLAAPALSRAQLRGRAGPAELPSVTLPGQLPLAGASLGPTLSVQPALLAPGALPGVSVVPAFSVAPSVTPAALPAVARAGTPAVASSLPPAVAQRTAPHLAPARAPGPVTPAPKAAADKPVAASLAPVTDAAAAFRSGGSDAAFVQSAGGLYEGRASARGGSPVVLGAETVEASFAQAAPARAPRASLLAAPRRAADPGEDKGVRPPPAPPQAPKSADEKSMSNWETALTAVLLAVLLAGSLFVWYQLYAGFAEMAVQYEYQLRSAPFGPDGWPF